MPPKKVPNLRGRNVHTRDRAQRSWMHRWRHTPIQAWTGNAGLSPDYDQVFKHDDPRNVLGEPHEG